MNIAGLQKMTLLDFPGKVACTVFLQGCNFRCPFCHNSDLLEREGSQSIREEELLTFLKKRKGILDGVCITGGEPTLQPDLEDLIRKIKALGYPVKLDTNGSRPDVLKRLAGEGLLDYVAMDIKNSPDRYPQTAGITRLDHVEESIRFLMTGRVDYEFRTTVVAELHSPEAVDSMGKWLSSLAPEYTIPRFYLQPYVDRDSVLFDGLHAPSSEMLEKYVGILRFCAENVSIRGNP